MNTHKTNAKLVQQVFFCMFSDGLISTEQVLQAKSWVYVVWEHQNMEHMLFLLINVSWKVYLLINFISKFLVRQYDQRGTKLANAKGCWSIWFCNALSHSTRTIIQTANTGSTQLWRWQAVESIPLTLRQSVWVHEYELTVLKPSFTLSSLNWETNPLNNKSRFAHSNMLIVSHILN